MKPPPLIDLNCDIGEDESPEGITRDLALLDVVSSVNIACGGHAGSEASMRRLAAACRDKGVRLGAHPGYEDRVAFGRVELDIDAASVRRSVAAQVARLVAIATECGAVVTHVKPHGALYHAAMRRTEIAGRRVEHEAFADRRYEPDGSLRSRTLPGAVLDDPALAAAQARSIARGHGVTLGPGHSLPMDATTLCIHSDSPGSLDIAKAVAAAITRVD